MTNKENTQEKSLLETFKGRIPLYLNYAQILYGLFRPMAFILVLNYVLRFVQTGLNMITPQFTGNTIDIVSRSKDMADFKEHILKLLVFSIVNHGFSNFKAKLYDKHSSLIRNKLKGELYKRLLECDMEFFDKHTPEEANTIVTSGVEQLISFSLYQVSEFFQIFIRIFGNLYLMYTTSPQLTYITFLMIPLKYYMNYSNRGKNQEAYKALGEITNEFQSTPSQVIRNISLIKCFATEEKEYNRYMDLQKKVVEAKGQISDNQWYIDLSRMLFNEVVRIAEIWIGGVLVFQGFLSVGQLSTFGMYSGTFSGTILGLKGNVQNILNSAKSAGKVLQILELNAKQSNSKNLKKENLKGSISIQQVSFNYPAKPEVEILTNINLEIKAGEATAFVGVSGSGKTTLTFLLQSLYNPTQGRIFIDGEDMRDYDTKWLRSHMGYVSQEPILLDRTIEENLVYGVHGAYSQELVEETLLKSNSKFILNKEKFPSGLSSKLGFGKDRIKLSGGQKQRIAIGRAFAKDPKILILDEPTSALDGESESKVQKAIDDLIALGDRTVIVVAHRLSTIINCQKIVVFEDGRVVEQGTHRELIAKNGAYKKLFEFQLESMKKL